MTSAYMPDIQVQIAFTSGYATPANERVWTDVSSYVELDEGISIGHGRTDERAQAGPNTLDLTLDNSDGRFTAGLDSSPYFPDVKLSRPLRVLATQVGGPSIVNPYFEVNAGNWTAQGGATFARSLTQSWEGDASGRMTWPAAAAGAAWVQTTMSNLIPGATYRVGVMAYVPVGSPPMGLNFGAATSADPDSVTVLEDAWTEMELNFTPTGTTHLLKIFTAGASTAGQLAYIDAISFASVRFLGYVDAWPTEWTEGVASYAAARVGASSRLARIGIGAKLPNMIASEVLVDNPVGYWTMSDPSGALTAANSSAQNVDALAFRGSGVAPVFGSATGPPTDNLTAVQLAGGKYLGGDLPNGTYPFASHCFVLRSGAPPVTEVVFSINAGLVEIRLATDGRVRLYVMSNLEVTSAASVCDGATHHVAAIFHGPANELYVDGVSEGTGANIIVTPTGLDLSVGGGGDPTLASATLTGVIAHMALHPIMTGLTVGSPELAARVLAWFESGGQNAAGEPAWARLERLAALAGISAAEYDVDHAATTPIQFVDTTDKTPAELMRQVEVTEAGVMFDARDNRLTYVSRNTRYNAPVALTLDFDLQQIEAGVQPRLDSTALVNDVTGSVPEGLSVRAVNAQSVADYGTRTDDIELITTDEGEVTSAAWWRVSIYGEPRSRVPALSVDALTLPIATQQALLAAEVSSRLEVLNWPTQVGTAYAAGFFIEGWTEAFGTESHTFALNVSPGANGAVFILDDPVYGVLDSPYPLAY